MIALTWRLVMLALVAGCAIGGATGASLTYKLVTYGQNAKALSDARTELRRYQAAVGIAEEIDDETIRWNITNDDISQAIIRKARMLGGERTVCVSADSMCQLHRLKLYTASPAGERAQCGEDHRIALETEAETTELIARLRASEVRNANAVLACQRFYHQLQRTWSGK